MTSIMESLASTYEKVKPSIVAIASRVSPQPNYLPIIGTGFVGREDGVIFTCDHVIKGIAKLPRAKGKPKEEWPAVVLFYHNIPDKGMITIPMDIQGAIGIQKYEHKGPYYGEDIPDMGALLVNYSGLPAMELSGEMEFREGAPIAVAGFPMGEDTLLAPGWLHQISPTLQSGIISAVLPFPCKAPHAYLMDVMIKGGSSGSPVFDPASGKVLGMAYAKLQERKDIDDSGRAIKCFDPTTLSFVLPSRYLARALVALEKTRESLSAKRGELRNIYERIDEAIKKQEYKYAVPKEPQLKDQVDVEFP